MIMSLFSKLLGIASAFTFLSLILYVFFGQTTVRKLRKNPNTKDALGTEFASGCDILNAAQALAIPKAWAQKLKNSPLSALYADVDVLYEHTTMFDKVLAFIFYWLFISSTGGLIFLVLLNAFGIFN